MHHVLVFVFLALTALATLVVLLCLVAFVLILIPVFLALAALTALVIFVHFVAFVPAPSALPSKGIEIDCLARGRPSGAGKSVVSELMAKAPSPPP